MITEYSNELYSGRSNVWNREYAQITKWEPVEVKENWDFCWKSIPKLKEEDGLHWSLVKFPR